MFNPRPNNQIFLNSRWKGSWQEDVVLEQEDAIYKLFTIGKPFELTIRVLSHGEINGSIFQVFLNRTFLTMFRCPADITTTRYITFAQVLCSSNDIKDPEKSESLSK